MKVGTTVVLRARIREMNAVEARGQVGGSAAAELSSSRPLFVELIAGHEGWSAGPLSGSARPARKLWSRERVAELASRLGAGVPVYEGHGGRERRPVGKMVSAAERWLHGVMAAAGVACILDPAARERVRSGELNTCSIEAEVELRRSPGEPGYVVDAVRRVTGIALGDRRRERPGFPGATVLAVVEEFEGEPAPDAVPEAAAAEGGGAGEEKEGDGLGELRRRVEQGERRVAELERELSRLRDTRVRVSAPAEPSVSRNPLIPRIGRCG